jgi:hypothetical protein
MINVNKHGDVFDLPHARAINEARKDLLFRYLRDRPEIHTVLDGRLWPEYLRGK